jgi:hypothetical protein
MRPVVLKSHRFMTQMHNRLKQGVPVSLAFWSRERHSIRPCRPSSTVAAISPNKPYLFTPQGLANIFMKSCRFGTDCRFRQEAVVFPPAEVKRHGFQAIFMTKSQSQMEKGKHNTANGVSSYVPSVGPNSNVARSLHARDDIDVCRGKHGDGAGE